MLGRGDDVRALEDVGRAGLALEATDELADIIGDELRIARIAFIGAAPATVPPHRDRRSDGPFLPGHAHFRRGRLDHYSHTPRIVTRSEPNFLRASPPTADRHIPVGLPDPPPTRFATDTPALLH